jgi:hypothetical protein
MRLPAFLLLIASAGSLAFAGDPEPDPEAPRTDVRRQILLEYKYTGPQGGSAPAAPVLPGAAAQARSAAAVPGDPAMVAIAPLEVPETSTTVALRAKFLKQEADARSAAVMSTLGIGVHVAPVGPVGFYAVTVFYIPVAVGFGISF